jgi:hypothetical protein
MADNLTQRGMGHCKRIAVDQEHEMRYWREVRHRAAGVERGRKAVGPQAADVERFLKSGGAPKPISAGG